MILTELIGKTFQEDKLYEILHFDIEQNFKNYLSKFIHIYFDHLEVNRIQINKIVYMADEDSLYVVNRKIIGTQGWIEIYNQCRNISLMICRQDRTGKLSVIGPDINHVQTFRKRSYTLPDQTTPLTPAEIAAAFAELAGMLEDHTPNIKT